MRIALRTSGGRGEYEIAGSHAGITNSVIYDKQFVVEITPDVKIVTDIFLRHMDGKPRMRLSEKEKGKRDKHIYSLMAAVCLLPKPIRELGGTGYGKLQIVDGKYSISDIEFDIVNTNASQVLIRPTTLRLSNGDSSEMLDIVQRMRLVFMAWNAVMNESFTTKYSYLLKKHYEAYMAGSFQSLIDLSDKIRKITDSDEDPLRQILGEYNLRSAETYDMGILTSNIIPFIDDNPLTLLESRQEIVRKWRQIAYRGVAGETFKREVNKAYNNTCLFTGYFLPRTPLTNSPGVDAAHILPWAKHGLNSIQNGLCLNKLCHWAFDQGILRLEFDEKTNDYLVSIPSEVKALGVTKIDLSPFTAIEGVIPKERLPSNHNLWPDPKLINQFNQQT